jgi:hypothetical protein
MNSRYTAAALLSAAALALAAGCGKSTTVNFNTYEFDRVVSAMELGSMSTPEVTDGDGGTEVNLGYNTVRYADDRDSSVTSTYPSFGLRKRLAGWSDVGIGFAMAQNNRFGQFDLKFVPLRRYLTLGADLAFQYYQEPAKGDGSCAAFNGFVSLPVLGDRLSFYTAPRLIRSKNLIRMVETVTTSGVNTDKDQEKTYAYTTTIGIGAGLVWAVPIRGNRLKVRPEIFYLAGQEQHYKGIVYEIVKPSLRVHWVF